MVVFDSSILMLVMRQGIIPPKDKKTGKPVTFAEERIEHLIQTLDKDRETICIPAPVLAEILAGAGDAISDYQRIITMSRFIEVAAFDHRAALESAALWGVKTARGKKRGTAKGAWQKVKVDQQIVAIAATHRATAVYTCDSDVEALCKDARLTAIRLEDLPIPKDAMQIEMPLSESSPDDPATGEADGPEKPITGGNLPLPPSDKPK